MTIPFPKHIPKLRIVPFPSVDFYMCSANTAMFVYEHQTIRSTKTILTGTSKCYHFQQLSR